MSERITPGMLSHIIAAQPENDMAADLLDARLERDRLLEQNKTLAGQVSALVDHLEIAWGLIANASGGDWTHPSNHKDWRPAAERWRDTFFRLSEDSASTMREHDARVRDATIREVSDHTGEPETCPECGAKFYTPGNLNIALHADREWRRLFIAGERREVWERAAKIADNGCGCHEGYKDRGLIDPDCVSHDIAAAIRSAAESETETKTGEGAKP